MKVTHERLLSLLSYDQQTGVFTWLVTQSRRTHVGDEAGYVAADGYRSIQIDDAKYPAHTLAWFYVYRQWCKRLDHKDTERDHNWIDNLRPATSAQNCQNARKPITNTSGFKGVDFVKSRGLFRAQIRNNGIRIFLGHYDTAAEAASVYQRAAIMYHGDFARAE